MPGSQQAAAISLAEPHPLVRIDKREHRLICAITELASSNVPQLWSDPCIEERTASRSVELCHGIKVVDTCPVALPT